MIPKAYELKRILAHQRHKFWCAEAFEGLPAAPVYLFPDQERFDSDEVDLIISGMMKPATPPTLPHRDVIFEVGDRGPDVSAMVAYVTTTIEGEIVGFLFVRWGSRWSDAQCHVHFKGDQSEWVTNPRIDSKQQGQTYASILCALVWRAVAILSNTAIVTENRVAQARRPKLARPGVSGWIYRIVDIDPQRLKAVVNPAGGTHASPCWHIRRGHWRTLPNGRRTFVRACEVGDAAKGGVVKDYRIMQGVAR